MTYVIIAIFTMIGLGVLQGFLSARENKFAGLIIPIISFVLVSIFAALRVTEGFTSVEGFGEFLSNFGGVGLFALILKIGLIYSPVIVFLIIYAIVRALTKRKYPKDDNGEINKMIAGDL